MTSYRVWGQEAARGQRSYLTRTRACDEGYGGSPQRAPCPLAAEVKVGLDDTPRRGEKGKA